MQIIYPIPNRIAKEKDGDLHDLNSCTRKTPGELQTRAKLGKYLPFPTTENARAVDTAFGDPVSRRAPGRPPLEHNPAAPPDAGRSERRWGHLHQPAGQGPVAHHRSWRLEASLRQKTESWWAAPGGGFQTGRVREAASDCCRDRRLPARSSRPLGSLKTVGEEAKLPQKVGKQVLIVMGCHTQGFPSTSWLRMMLRDGHGSERPSDGRWNRCPWGTHAGKHCAREDPSGQVEGRRGP